MATNETLPPSLASTLSEIQSTLQSIQRDYQQLAVSIEAIEGRLNVVTGDRDVEVAAAANRGANATQASPLEAAKQRAPRASSVGHDGAHNAAVEKTSSSPARSFSAPSRIILTTYPGQAGIDPITMNWGHQDPSLRGPVVVSRSQSTIRRRNGMVALSSCSFIFP